MKNFVLGLMLACVATMITPSAQAQYSTASQAKTAAAGLLMGTMSDDTNAHMISSDVDGVWEAKKYNPYYTQAQRDQMRAIRDASVASLSAYVFDMIAGENLHPTGFSPVTYAWQHNPYGNPYFWSTYIGVAKTRADLMYLDHLDDGSFTAAQVIACYVEAIDITTPFANMAEDEHCQQADWLYQINQIQP